MSEKITTIKAPRAKWFTEVEAERDRLKQEVAALKEITEVCCKKSMEKCLVYEKALREIKELEQGDVPGFSSIQVATLLDAQIIAHEALKEAKDDGEPKLPQPKPLP